VYIFFCAFSISTLSDSPNYPSFPVPEVTPFATGKTLQFV